MKLKIEDKSIDQILNYRKLSTIRLGHIPIEPELELISDKRVLKTSVIEVVYSFLAYFCQDKFYQYEGLEGWTKEAMINHLKQHYPDINECSEVTFIKINPNYKEIVEEV